MDTIVTYGERALKRRNFAGKTWVTADWHLNHGQKFPDEEPRGIIKYTKRPFKTTGEMDDAIIERLNEKVAPTDLLVHLGDVGFFGKHTSDRQIAAMMDAYWKKIRCKNIIIVWGNHDKRLRGNEYIDHWFIICANCLELKIDDKVYLCQHYPELSWDRSFHGTRQLHGHCHMTIEGCDPLALRTDVGVDGSNFYPLDIEAIEERMKPIEEARKVAYTGQRDEE